MILRDKAIATIYYVPLARKIIKLHNYMYVASLESGHGVKDEDLDSTDDSGISTAFKYYDDPDPYCVVELCRRRPRDIASAGKSKSNM